MKLVPLMLLLTVGGRAGDCRIVEGDRIHAADVAPVIPEFEQLDPSLDLGPAPLAGARRVLQPDEVLRLARRIGIVIGKAIPFCLERATESFEPQSVIPVLSSVLAKSSGEIEILDYSRNPLPYGKPEFGRPGPDPHGIWRGLWVEPSGRTTAIWVRIRTAQQPSVSSREVERGDQVRVEASSGGVLLGLEGRAETSGHTGEGVVIKNPESGRSFRAKVESRGKVVVNK